MTLLNSATSISVGHHGDIVVLTVEGAIDLATGPAVQKAIDAVIAEGPQGLIVDLSQASLLSSIGLTILASTRERLSGVAGFAVAADHPIVVRPIQLTCLDRYLSLCPTVEAAATHIRAGRPND